MNKPKQSQSVLVFIFLFGFVCSRAQNIIQNEILSDAIETIVISGNQIFKISVSTSKTDYIRIKSILDGEYQNEFQINAKHEKKELTLSLERMSFGDIADDKRNAHKVIAATLIIEIPEKLSIHIFSDVGSVDLIGNFNALSIELLQGHCEIEGNVSKATINTIDGDISVVTKRAKINAKSSNGIVVLDAFSETESLWTLQSINGNITVAKQE